MIKIVSVSGYAFHISNVTEKGFGNLIKNIQLGNYEIIRTDYNEAVMVNSIQYIKYFKEEEFDNASN